MIRTFCEKVPFGHCTRNERFLSDTGGQKLPRFTQGPPVSSHAQSCAIAPENLAPSHYLTASSLQIFVEGADGGRK